MSDNQAPQLPRLHFITDTQCQDRWSDIQLATAVLEGGGELIQYRDKFEDSTRTRLERARELAQVCQQHDATLIINDRADIAKCTNGAGLHLGPTRSFHHKRKTGYRVDPGYWGDYQSREPRPSSGGLYPS